MQRTFETITDPGPALARGCAEQRRSMRSLSHELGHGDKYVADIVAGRSRRPDPEVLVRLAEITGLPLAAAATDARSAVRAGVYLDRAIELVLQSQLPGRGTIARDVQHLCHEWLRREPAEVPADPRWLRAKMQGWNGATHGVSDKRLADVRSHLNRALQLVGNVATDRKPIRAVAPVWRALAETVPMVNAGGKRGARGTSRRCRR